MIHNTMTSGLICKQSLTDVSNKNIQFRRQKSEDSIAIIVTALKKNL
jgi:hypothetical protein